MAVKYISTFSVCTLHAMINKAFLKMLCNIYDRDFECYVTASSKDMLRDCAAQRADIKWHTLPLITNSSKIALLLRYIFSAVYNLFILLTSRRNDVLFYNFNNVFSTWLIDLVNRFMHRKIVICCHGELEYLTNAAKHSKGYKKLMTWLTVSYFNQSRHAVAEGLYYLVLGDVILQNLKPLISEELFERFHSIDHPIIDDVPQVHKPQSDAKNVGTVGIMNYYKGSDDYAEIARSVTNKRVKFSVVGQVQCDAKSLTDAGIDIPADSNNPLPDSDFKEKVLNLDYLLYLYPRDNYKLIASGAVLDTIRFRRPGIGIRTDYFDYLAKKYGDIGLFVEDKQQLIEQLNNLPDKDYDFDAIAKKLSVEAITPSLRKIMHAL